MNECLNTPALTDKEVRAVQAIHRGDADGYQQKLALAAIVTKFSRSHDLAFIPDSVQESAFLAGRTFVGKEILKVIGLPLSGKEEE